MTDRHIHCVYFQYDDSNDLDGYCLLKCKNIDIGFGPCCENIVLRPSELLEYFLVHNNYCDSWGDAAEEVMEYLNITNFNNYPKKEMIQ